MLGYEREALLRRTVLVSHLAMPETDGHALIRELRAREPAHGGHVPALAFTALAGAEDRIRALAAGFDGYVVKPVNLMQLVAAVASVTRAGPAEGRAERE